MRAPLSIIIPALNAGQELPATLACLMEGVSDGLIREVVVSDGGSSDETLTIADEAGAVMISGPAGRGGQLRRGADAATGTWFLFLHADTHLSPGWSQAVRLAIDNGTPAYFWLRFRSNGAAAKAVAAWANLRSRALRLPYGDQGLLISSADYRAAGGYDDIPLMEDVALARRLPKIAPMGSYAQTSANRYEASGWLRRGGRNLWTLARYWFGADPGDLARAYRRR